MDNTRSSTKEDEEKTAYILLGWPDESMKKRVTAITRQIENNIIGKIIITGYEFEIEKIKDLLKDALTEEIYNKVELEEVLSYDTFTNISKIKEETNAFDNYNNFVVSTSKSHGRRVEMIFERLFIKSASHENEFYNNPENPNKFTLKFINSEESEVGYARLAENIYKNVNPKILQYASIALRPNKFIAWYLIPIIKKKGIRGSMKRYLFSCLPWKNQAST